MRELLAEAAEAGATRLWRRHGCRSEQEALSMVATALTARLGVAFVRAQAKLLRKRIHLAEPGGGTAREGSGGERELRSAPRGRRGL